MLIHWSYEIGRYEAASISVWSFVLSVTEWKWWPLWPSVSGIKVKRHIGAIESTSEAIKLVTWSKCSTNNCPPKFDKVAPKPKQLAVRPTVKQEERGNNSACVLDTIRSRQNGML